MKSSFKTLLICILIPILTGLFAGFLTKPGLDQYTSVSKPAFTPPAWVFPVVWLILYLLMGLASYYIIISDANTQSIYHALALYIVQLVVNFVWSIIFFNLQWYFVSFVLIIILWILILLTLISFYRISKKAGYLMIPYLFWVTFAAILAYEIWKLN